MAYNLPPKFAVTWPPPYRTIEERQIEQEYELPPGSIRFETLADFIEDARYRGQSIAAEYDAARSPKLSLAECEKYEEMLENERALVLAKQVEITDLKLRLSMAKDANKELDAQLGLKGTAMAALEGHRNRLSAQLAEEKRYANALARAVVYSVIFVGMAVVLGSTAILARMFGGQP